MINLDNMEEDEIYDVDVYDLYDRIAKEEVIFAGRLCNMMSFSTIIDSSYGDYIELVLHSHTGEYTQRYRIIESDLL